MLKVKADIRDIVLKYGAKNVFVLMQCDRVESINVNGIRLSYTSSANSPVTTICTIDESRYNIVDGYKVTLVPPAGSNLAKNSLYQSDFNQMLVSGTVKVLIDVKNI